MVASPLCAPSRACLAAGKEYDRCRVPGNNADYPLDQTTFYTLLRESGYHVSGCGKFDLHKKSPVWGLDGNGLLREWGFSDGIDNEGKGDAVMSGAVAPKGPYMAYLHARGLAAAHVADFKRRKDYSVTFAHAFARRGLLRQLGRVERTAPDARLRRVGSRGTWR